MSSRAMSLDVLVRLRDRLTGPLKRLRDQLKSLADFGRKIGLLGAAIAAISFMGPIKEAAAFQQKLLDIAGTSDLSGKAAFKFVDQARERYEALALASGQASQTIADGAGQMTAAGLDAKLIEGSLGDIAKAATAANADFSDMAGVATSLMQTLKVPADQLKDTLAGLDVSGKLGAFELKDMARYFPTLTSQMTKYGVKGREAANELASLLQISRKGTSDPAEAANNLKNFLSKIAAPATIKNFKDAGVDIEAVMKDAATKGISPIEAVLQKISKLTTASGVDIGKMMSKAKASGLEGADALANVREQLEKIHGAGKLGTLFADQQVMDFLIPFLANIDEYKRIKAEVAKATGAVIDRDAETQLAGLNRQLQTFQEIGVQASREVGFAFGTWLPMINENLAAALKWYRAWNKETGGLGTKLLTLAGGGVLAATALGALGIALPVIGAGFAALGALLSPLGVVLTLIAGAGVYLYKNWGTYGPRLMRIWDSTKRGFFSFIDGARDRIGRIVAAGREIYDRFAPMVSRGFNAAWNDIKDGWENVKSFIETVAKSAGIKFDLSGLTIDNAKLVAMKGLALAMQGIAAAWQGLKDFGSGFALHLPKIGDDIGKTIKAFGDIGNSLGRIAAAVAKMTGLDTAKFDGFFNSLGNWAGSVTSSAAAGIRMLADGIASLTKAIADFAEGKPIDWASLIPGPVQGAWTTIKDTFAAIVKAITDLVSLVASGIDWSKLIPTSVIDAWNGLAAAIASVKDALNGGPDNPKSNAVAPEWEGPVNKPTVIDPKVRLKDLRDFAKPDISNWKMEQAAKETEAAKKAGTLDNGPWWQKQPVTKPAPIETKDALKELKNFAKSDIADWKLEQAKKETEAAKKAGTLDNGPWWTKKGNDNKPAAAVPKQTVEVKGSISVTATAGATVNSVTSSNKDVPLVKGNNGRVVGRV